MKKQKVVGRVKFFLELRMVRINDVANENKELGVLSKERERERITKDFGNPEKA